MTLSKVDLPMPESPTTATYWPAASWSETAFRTVLAPKRLVTAVTLSTLESYPMEQPVDLTSYFERIGFRGAPSPTLETLQQLHLLHAQAIPFEGLSPFIGEEVRLDAASLEDKLIGRGRGGYCFEQNVLFWRVLRTIGFSVIGLGGRVRLNWPDDFITPRGHMLLLINLPEGRYIADVGFGGLTMTAAIRLETGIEQRTPH